MKSIAKIMLFFIIVSLTLTVTTGIFAFADGNVVVVQPGITLATASNGIMSPTDVTDETLEQTTKDSLAKISGSIMRWLLVIGAMAMVVVLAIYGLQWLTASPQQKAVLKEKAWSFLIGAILVFGGATILTAIVGAIGKAFK